MPLEPGEQDAAAEDEDAGVPQVLAAGHEPFGGGVIGLLGEAPDTTQPRRARKLFRHFEIAEPGLRPRRNHTEGEDPGLALDDADGQRERRAKRLGIPDPVVRRQHDHGTLAGASSGIASSDQPIAGAVLRAAGSLRMWRERNLGQLLRDGAPKRFRGRDPDLLRRHQRLQTIDRGLQERALALEREELLGTISTARRPKTSSGASGEDEGASPHFSPTFRCGVTSDREYIGDTRRAEPS